MADKELRRMNRTELIEIIYALQQNEQKLREENDKMAAELEDRKIRMDESGSIAEAALSLNHIFEDAQAAADQYLLSLHSMEEDQPKQDDPEMNGTEDEKSEPVPENRIETPQPGPDEILEDARRQADGILNDARREAEEILNSAREQADSMTAGEAKQEADEILEDARCQADGILKDARLKADDILASAREEAQAESQKTLESVKEQCNTERQAVKEYHDKFLHDMSDVLNENPELLERVRKLGSVEGA